MNWILGTYFFGFVFVMFIVRCDTARTRTFQKGRLTITSGSRSEQEALRRDGWRAIT